MDYFWKLDGEDVSTAASYGFITDFLGDYSSENSPFEITLDVTDNYGITRNRSRNSLTYTWNVMVNNVNQPPVADAGEDDEVYEGEEYQLDGTGSFDLDGDSLTYIWTAPDGITLDDNSSPTPSFIAPQVPTNESVDYVFTLIVDDGIERFRVESDPDEVIITVLNYNQPPVADAGEDAIISEELSVYQLDGSGSYDPEGDPITYSWSGDIALDDSTSPTPSFNVPDVEEDIVYEFILIVNDNRRRLESEPDTVFITIEDSDPPSLTEFSINNGALETTSKTVNLDHEATHNPTQYKASESADFNDVLNWIDYTYPSAPQFELSEGYGVKTVYFKVRNEFGESVIFSDEIEYIRIIEGNNEVLFYPNPFNPDESNIVIKYKLKKSGKVDLWLYDTSNKLVKKLIDGENHSADNEFIVEWDGKNQDNNIVANGVYFLMFKSSSGFRKIRKISVLR